MSFILSGFIRHKELCLNKAVKALREDIFMYKQMIPAPYVEGTRAKSVNFTDASAFLRLGDKIVQRI